MNNLSKRPSPTPPAPPLGLFSIPKNTLINNGRVTKIENIKTNLTKILRPTHFSGMKDIKTDKITFDLIPRIFFLIGVLGLNISSRIFGE